MPLCSEGPCAGPDPGSLGHSTECCARDTVLSQALLLWPVLPPLTQPSPLLSQECPGTAHALVWEPGLSIYLELALRSLAQGGAARAP